MVVRVRVRLLILLFMIPAAAGAQRLQFGLKTNYIVSKEFKVNERNYYFSFLEDDRSYDASVKGIDVQNKIAVEFFSRYDHSDRLFFQYGLTRFGSTYNFQFASSDVFEGELPELMPGERSYIDPAELSVSTASFHQYLSVGTVISVRTPLKVYASLGVISDSFLGYSNVYSSDFLEVNSYLEEREEAHEIIVNDLERNHKRSNLLGRVAIGFRYHALHLEFIAMKNLGSIDTSSSPFYKSMTALQISAGYNLLSFNTVRKKSRI